MINELENSFVLFHFVSCFIFFFLILGMVSCMCTFYTCDFGDTSVGHLIFNGMSNVNERKSKFVKISCLVWSCGRGTVIVTAVAAIASVAATATATTHRRICCDIIYVQTQFYVFNLIIFHQWEQILEIHKCHATVLFKCLIDF